MSIVAHGLNEAGRDCGSEPALAVQLLNPLTIPSWDEFVQAWSDYTFFHGQAWARVLHRTYGHRPCYALLDGAVSEAPPKSAHFAPGEGGAGDQNLRPKSQVLIPLMEVRSLLTGCRGVGLPFTDECSPLGGGVFISPTSSYLLAPASPLLDLARKRGWRFIEVRGGPPPEPGATPSVSFFGHRLNLAGRSPEALFQRCELSVRRATRKAQQSGLRVELSQTLDAVHDFYALHIRTRRKHGVPPQPFAFFRNIHEEIMAKGLGFVAIARLELRAVAASVFFHLGKRAIYKFGASDERQQHLRANNLVMWEAISWFARQGFESLHFGRTSLSNDGLRRFKLGWGTEEETLCYYRFDLRRHCWLTGADRASGWHNHLFRHLPAWPNRVLGALLYPHLD